MSNENDPLADLRVCKTGTVGAKINTREALKRIHRILDSFFVEGEMDFGVEVWWEAKRGLLLKN